MSHRATVWAINQKLPALAKLVLLILADRHNNDTNRCDPSIDRMATDCGMSPDSVRRHLKVLTEKGLISVHPRRSGPVNLTNRYSFNMQRLTPVPANSEYPVLADSDPNQEVLKPGSKEGEDAIPRKAVRRLFTYYLEVTKRNGKIYTLTDQRMIKGLARLAECTQKCGGDPAKGEELMGIVIDSLGASDFHMGKNPEGKQYIDWTDHLFKNADKVEWWLNR